MLILYSILSFALFEQTLSTCNIKFYIHCKACMPQKFLGKYRFCFYCPKSWQGYLSHHRGQAIKSASLMTCGSLSYVLKGTIMKPRHSWDFEPRTSPAPHFPRPQHSFHFCTTPKFATQVTSIRNIRKGLRTREVTSARGCVENFKLSGWQEPFIFLN